RRLRDGRRREGHVALRAREPGVERRCGPALPLRSLMKEPRRHIEEDAGAVSVSRSFWRGPWPWVAAALVLAAYALGSHWLAPEPAPHPRPIRTAAQHLPLRPPPTSHD